jgi:hypothetical protein
MLTGLRCYPLAIAGRSRFCVEGSERGPLGRKIRAPVAGGPSRRALLEVVDAASGAVPCVERYLCAFWTQAVSQSSVQSCTRDLLCWFRSAQQDRSTSDNVRDFVVAMRETTKSARQGDSGTNGLPRVCRVESQNDRQEVIFFLYRRNQVCAEWVCR